MFTIVLFVAAPFILHRHFGRLAAARPQFAFAVMQRVHWVLLFPGVVTIVGALAGSQAWSIL